MYGFKIQLNYFSFGDYLTQQFAKNGIIPEKYDGPLYDDINVVIVDEPPTPEVNDTVEVEDEPKLFKFSPQEAPIFRG